MNKRRARNPFRLLLALVAAGALVAVGGAAFCRAAARSPAGTATGYVGRYDWAGLERDGDRLAYYEQGALRSRLGIDVSSHQGTVDWEAVAADGIDFALVRLGNRGYTEGSLHVDEQGAANLDGARAAGLDVGAYFFSQATTVRRGSRRGRPRFEASGRAHLGTARGLRPRARAGRSGPRQRGGRRPKRSRPARSRSANGWKRPDTPPWSTAMPATWPATTGRPWAGAPCGSPNTTWQRRTPRSTSRFWQYSNSGDVQGVSTPVDMNLLFPEP